VIRLQRFLRVYLQLIKKLIIFLRVLKALLINKESVNKYTF